MSFLPARFAWLLCAGLVLLLAAPALRAEEAPAVDPAAIDEDADQETETVETATLPWVYDFEAAKKQAAQEGKDLFLDFTGSDWCGWCKRLESEVFSHASFVDAATERYVFVYLDFPRSEEAKAKVVDLDLNRELATSYGVGGYPTIVLTTADGAPYGRTGYREGGPETYLEHLLSLHENGEKVKALLAAKGKQGVDALKAGFEILGDGEFLGYPDYAWILTDAEKMDPEGEKGLKALVVAERERQQALAAEQAFQQLLEGVTRKEDLPFEKLREFVDNSQSLSGQALATGCMLVGEWLLMEQEDPAAAKTYFEKALTDSMVKNTPRAKQHFEGMVQRSDDALEAPAQTEDDNAEDGEEDSDEE